MRIQFYVSLKFRITSLSADRQILKHELEMVFTPASYWEIPDDFTPVSDPGCCRQ